MDSLNDYDDTSDYNELFLAVHNGELNLVQSLLEKYSSTETIRGRTLLHVATARGHTEIAKLFIPKRNGIIDTPLHLAIRENLPELFSLLLEDNNLNARNQKDERPLHFAALYNRPEFTKTLLDNGASIEVKDRNGNTPLDVSLAKQNVRIAEILFKHGAVLSDDSLKDMEPLFNAVRSRSFEMVKLLMANGCNKVDVPPEYSSLTHAVISGRLDIIEYLIKNGVKNRETVNNDRLGLFETLISQGGSIDTFKFLVDVGIKVQNLNELLNSTFISGRHDMWQCLVTRFSKMNANTYFKEKQLHSFIRMGQVNTIKAIVNEPSNEYESDTWSKKLAVYIAVESGSEEILEILLEAGYPVANSSFKFISPLHLAATFEHPRLVKLLLKAGADVNLQTEDRGRTPLHFAATAAQPAVVKFLLNNGADPSKFDCSPLKEALEIHSNSLNRTPVTPLLFEILLKLTKMLIRNSNSKTNKDLFLYAAEIRVLSSINNSTSKSLLSNERGSVFRPEIVRCICNYLSNREVESCSQLILSDEVATSYPPDLLKLMMEYNDSKSCFDLEMSIWYRNENCQLLMIGYSKNVDDLLLSISGTIKDYNNDHYTDAERKNKTELLKLLVCRLVLLNTICDPSQFEEYELMDDIIEWQENCVQEKIVMQTTKVHKNLKLTFYDVLTKSIDKLAGYTNNEDFLTAMKSSDEKFPIYADFLKANVEMAERRRNYIDESTALMYCVVKKCYKIRLSTFDIRHIFQYLSIVDWQRFLAACS